MRQLRIAAFSVAAALAMSPAWAQASPTPAGSAAPAAAAPAAGPSLHHLVYEWGYNQKAASQGNNTGTTTVDITGVAADGGLNVSATDNWWNAVQPKQSAHCEVYPNGSVTCSKAPYNLTTVQASVLPLLGRSFFAQLSGGSGTKWTANFAVKASFAPGVNRGFAGQVSTWDFSYNMIDKGTTPQSTPIILLHYTGSIKQQGGRYTQLSTEANVLYDPRLKLPVYVNNLSRFVPAASTSSYSWDIKLIKYQ